ncbi:UNVERIFIED_CONTAM: MICOS complex subunit Mic19 [Gekko kuhli]
MHRPRCLRSSATGRSSSANGHSDPAPELKLIKMRYESHPVCADLQSKILQCYQQNSQQTLSCSALASEYFKCVNHAKQVGSEQQQRN